MHEHPILAHYQETHDGTAHRISDFLSLEKFRRTALYNEHFRPMHVKYCMGTLLPASPPLAVAIGLHRSQKDFSELDRQILNLLRPHLVQAWQTAMAVTLMKKDLVLFGQGLDSLNYGFITLTRERRVRLVNSKAQQWLTEYFGKRAGLASRLPDALERWVKEQRTMLFAADGYPSPRKPLIVEREGKQLVIRLINDSEQSFLLMEEQRTTVDPELLKLLGLTDREADVLPWVALGKTNEEIGVILDMSPRTVEKHLEHIYAKLGVESRTAAAARAYEIVSRK